jgi:hypothetical protein
MDRSAAFNQAPDLSRDFHAPSGEFRPPIDAANWPTQDEVEQLSLANRAYTPGGDLEYQVHKSVRYERTNHVQHTPVEHDCMTPKELNFDKDFQSASAPLSPEALRAQINKELGALASGFERAAGPDRGGPDR